MIQTINKVKQMDDVFFELGLLRSVSTSYISLLPIPILEKIKNYLKGDSATEYIIWDKEENSDVYTSNNPTFNDFFIYISRHLLSAVIRGGNHGYYKYNNDIYHLIEYIVKDETKSMKQTIDILTNNRQLLFDVLRENKRYQLITRYTHEYYKND